MQKKRDNSFRTGTTAGGRKYVAGRNKDGSSSVHIGTSDTGHVKTRDKYGNIEKYRKSASRTGPDEIPIKKSFMKPAIKRVKKK